MLSILFGLGAALSWGQAISRAGWHRVKQAHIAQSFTAKLLAFFFCLLFWVFPGKSFPNLRIWLLCHDCGRDWHIRLDAFVSRHDPGIDEHFRACLGFACRVVPCCCRLFQGRIAQSADLHWIWICPLPQSGWSPKVKAA